MIKAREVVLTDGFGAVRGTAEGGDVARSWQRRGSARTALAGAAVISGAATTSPSLLGGMIVGVAAGASW
jgi:hypothetical protein